MPEPIQPATDEQIARWEAALAAPRERMGADGMTLGIRVSVDDALALIARIRKAEAQVAGLSRALLLEHDEAAGLREQVAAMQAADAGAFW